MGSGALGLVNSTLGAGSVPAPTPAGHAVCAALLSPAPAVPAPLSGRRGRVYVPCAFQIPRSGVVLTDSAQGWVWWACLVSLTTLRRPSVGPLILRLRGVLGCIVPRVPCGPLRLAPAGSARVRTTGAFATRDSDSARRIRGGIPCQVHIWLPCTPFDFPEGVVGPTVCLPACRPTTFFAACLPAYPRGRRRCPWVFCLWSSPPVLRDGGCRGSP